MLDASKTRLLILLVCIALAVIRIGGVHLHLSVDGSTMPHDLHFADSGLHHSAGHHSDEHHTDSAHEDRDLFLTADLLTKKNGVGADFDFVAAFLFIGLVLLVFGPQQARPMAQPPPRPRWRVHILPPLRGPPRAS